MAHAIVRTDNMCGTDNRVDVVSLRYYVVSDSTSTATAIDNGNVVKLSGLETNERSLYKAVMPAATDALEDIILVAEDELFYDQQERDVANFYNAAGDTIRGYRIRKGCIFSITKDGFDGNATIEVGDIVELKAGTKLNVVDSLTSGSTKVGEIVAVDTVGRYTYYVVDTSK